MAKKSTTPAKRTSVKKGARPKKGASKPTHNPILSTQLLKILSGLTILAMLVLALGFVTDLFLKDQMRSIRAALRPNEPVTAAPTPLPTVKPKREVKPKAVPKPKRRPKPDTPVYEVYTPDTPHAPSDKKKPLEQLDTIPGDQPPMVAIIIDDMGYDKHIADRLMALDLPLTFSMLPYGTYSRNINDKAHAQGFETMLHLPMEPKEYPKIAPGPGGLLTEMSPDDLIDQLNRNLDQFAGLKGVNNHMGSRISASAAQMRQIFSILKKRRLFYIDSRTSAESVAALSAQKLQLPFAERDIFIDHYDNEAFIRKQLQSLIKRAQTQGYAVGIGHPHEVTYRMLKAFVPRLKKEVAVVPASMLVQQVMFAKAGSAQARR